MTLQDHAAAAFTERGEEAYWATLATAPIEDEEVFHCRQAPGRGYVDEACNAAGTGHASDPVTPVDYFFRK